MSNLVTKARRWLWPIALVSSVQLISHCGSLPEVVSEEILGGVCESLYGDECGRVCSLDVDCGDGLYCGEEGECTAECGAASDTCASTEACSARGRCNTVVVIDTPGTGGTAGILMTTTGATEGAGGSEECAAVLEEATEVKRPMDVIVSIDNSGSMAGEIVAVQQRINSEFAQIIEGSGIDYRVILVSRYGNVFSESGGNGASFGICIGSPLSGLECPADAQMQTPPVAHNAPRFFHHSTDIGSHNMWCRLIESMTEADHYPEQRNGWVSIAENGWQEFLRPEAFKVFIGITDDNPANDGNNGCDGSAFTDSLAGALAFDETIRDLYPEQFGAISAFEPDAGRNYAWYSIVGMAGNDPVSPTPLTPEDAVEPLCCQADGDAVNCPEGNNVPEGDGVSSGVGYQELSRLTGGLRYPSCYNDNFDDVFNAIAEGIIEGARLNCEWAIPEPPEGEIFDKDRVNVEYQPGDGSDPLAIGKVPSASDCGPSGGWYYDDEQAPAQVLVCPSTCDSFRSDSAGRVGILFGCATIFEIVE